LCSNEAEWLRAASGRDEGRLELRGDETDSMRQHFVEKAIVGGGVAIYKGQERKRRWKTARQCSQNLPTQACFGWCCGSTWASSATRGQITKIDANAAGYDDMPTGQQFEDVAVGSAFYTDTYRLATRSIMGGYLCGGPSEPCNPPDNLPYFRPNNNATRGQISKIVSNTFFPNCQSQAR
jgi:hypothetical protein